ncbi:MAG: hypothetical protein K2X29_09810, partial [Candidatus Obscuribacterales bacterium]|nr:hypothetical protein [Candidatus Obscuribacterales bacterium]
MALSKNFENKDSRSERSEGGKNSGGSPFDVLSLLGMPKDIQKAVDGLKHLVEQAGKHGEQKPAVADTHKATANDGHQDFKRGSLLHAETPIDHHQKGVLVGRLTHNETPHHNPSHLSAFLLKRLHERTAQHHNPDVMQQPQLDQQPMTFNQQPQEQHPTNWQE